MSNQFSWTDVLTLLSPAGQMQIVEIVRKAKDERGSKWIEFIKAEYPMASWLVDLVANKTAEVAYAELEATYSTWPIWFIKGQIFSLHENLNAEINKERKI